MSKNQKVGLDQYGTERFGRLIFAAVRKNVGLKGLMPDLATYSRESSKGGRVIEKQWAGRLMLGCSSTPLWCCPAAVHGCSSISQVTLRAGAHWACHWWHITLLV